MERIVEKELETLKMLADELEKDFSVLLMKGIDSGEAQKIKIRIKKHIVSLQMLISDLRNDLDLIEEWR